MNNNKSIILFDGICNLCNGFVDFILKHEGENKFDCIPIQSEKGSNLLNEYNIDSRLKTVIYIKGDKVFKESTAALRIIRMLKGLWPILYVLIVFPPFIRDGVYRWVARNRYKWFGKRESCRLPEEFDS